MPSGAARGASASSLSSSPPQAANNRICTPSTVRPSSSRLETGNIPASPEEIPTIQRHCLYSIPAIDPHFSPDTVYAREYSCRPMLPTLLPKWVLVLRGILFVQVRFQPVLRLLGSLFHAYLPTRQRQRQIGKEPAIHDIATGQIRRLSSVEDIEDNLSVLFKKE